MACDERVLEGHSATGGRSFYNVATLLIVISIFTLSVDALLKPFVIEAILMLLCALCLFQVTSDSFRQTLTPLSRVTADRG
jgi:hypothetical protein